MKKIYLIALLLLVFIISAASCSSGISSTITAESEPITINECSEIYYENQEDFEAVKEFLLSLQVGDVYIGLDDQADYRNFLSEFEIDKETEKHLSTLKECGVKRITKMQHVSMEDFFTLIDFYIDGTASSEYGVSWHTINRKFTTTEVELSENWYSYFMGYY